MNSFESRDLAKGLEDVDIGAEELPVQRGLGICWNLNSDFFLFQVSPDEKLLTRRGMLNTINSIFDPLMLVIFGAPGVYLSDTEFVAKNVKTNNGTMMAIEMIRSIPNGKACTKHTYSLVALTCV
jgi:hypothetical protein